MDKAEKARAARVVRQHAETSKLMGVDFVPVRVDAGVDAAAAEVSADVVETPRKPSARPQAASTAGAPATGSRDAKAVAAELETLRARYEEEAPHSSFVTAHNKIVWGDGDPCARLMIIGEAPGADEDRTGIPFVGRAGKLLDKMIVAIGLAREDVYITNVLKTRPPNNATPTIEEAHTCAPFLFEQIRIIHPEVIMTVGLPATRLILESTDSMGRLRGHWGEYKGPDGTVVPVLPTYHPAYLLRAYTRENRQKVWSDLQMVMDRLGLEPSGTSEHEGA